MAYIGRTHDAHGSRRDGARPSQARARSWTGRAVTSRSTDSTLPTFVTAGTRRTRVSEMRLVPRAGRRSRERGAISPGTATPQRRNVGGLHRHRRHSG
jgi:hypothetical protein